MTESPITALKLGDHFAQLVTGGAAVSVPVDEDFWQSGIHTLPPGRLVSLYRFAGDWPNWERHPAGDELVFQISGVQTFILEREQGEDHIRLGPGEFLIVPAGIWHTANVDEPGEALFITPGEGTEHRDR